jgi:hypothetical protein
MAMPLRAWIAVVLLTCAAPATAQQPDLRELAQRAWDANLAAYEAGEVRLFAAYRFSQEVYHSEPEPSMAAFHERLTALEARASGRAPDLQTIGCLRALVAAQEQGRGPSTEGVTAVAAIGSLLATHRDQLEAGGGEPDDFFAWSHALRSVERELAALPHPAEQGTGDGTFLFDEEDDGVVPAWDRAHHERQVWLATTLRAQGRAALAEYYRLMASPDEEGREEPVLAAAQTGFERAWAAFKNGGADALAVETWSRRCGNPGGPRTREGIELHESEHLARMRAVEEVARARPKDAPGDRLRAEAALLVALAARR